MFFGGGIRFCGFRVGPLNGVRFSGNKNFKCSSGVNNTTCDTFTPATKSLPLKQSSGSHPLLYFLGFNFLMRKIREEDQ
ncbi:MAG: hypothetical protein AB1782_20090 [Cyanobacteriota bacterium]